MSEQQAVRGLAAPVPIDEGGRLAAVRRVVHDPARRRPMLDDLVLVAQRLLDVPQARVTMVDQRREVTLADVGHAGGSVPRDESLCAHTILQHTPLVVGDLARDLRVPGLDEGAYIGAPIRTPDGHALGAVAGLDVRPRRFDESHAHGLAALAETAAESLEGEAIAQRVVSYAVQDLVVDHRDDDPLAEVLAEALQLVVDHEAWRVAWAHIGISGHWNVVGSAGVDPSDLDMGLALYEMRHRLEDLRPGEVPFLIDVAHAPSSLARIAEQLGVRQFLVVPLTLAPDVQCSVVLGMRTPPEMRVALMGQLGNLARQISAEVVVARQARAPEAEVAELLTQLRAIDDLCAGSRVGLAKSLCDPLRLVHRIATTYLEASGHQPHAKVLASVVESDPDLGLLLGDVIDLADRRRRDHRTEVVVADLVAGAVQRAMQRHGRPVALTMRVDALRATVEAPRLARAVEAMVDNALRHTPAGTAVEVTASPVGADRFEVVVSDDGPGVPDAIKSVAFTASPGLPRRGVGLGLVAAAAALHRGRAWVDDRPGGGTRFHLRLAVS